MSLLFSGRKSVRRKNVPVLTGGQDNEQSIYIEMTLDIKHFTIMDHCIFRFPPDDSA